MSQLRKRFGQHLLIDYSVIDKIISAIAPKVTDDVVEIGPGLGALTFPLSERLNQLIAVELDRDFIPYLQEKAKQNKKQLTLYQADALTFDFATLSKTQKLRVVGNLPYNISTPLLFHLAEQRHVIQDMHFMLQEEVVQRLAAEVNTNAYGRLSVMLQTDFEIEALFSVPPTAFKPPPKVYSAVVRLVPKLNEQQETIVDRHIFANIVREAFQYRRKTLRNALKAYVSEQNLLKLAINPQSRAAELSVSDYIKLANYLAKKE